MSKPNLLDLKQEIMNLMEYEKEKCSDQKDSSYFCGYHAGKYDGLELVLGLINSTDLK